MKSKVFYSASLKQHVAASEDHPHNRTTFKLHLRCTLKFKLYIHEKVLLQYCLYINTYPTAFPYGNGTVLHFYQQQESSTTKTVHKVINKGLKSYV